VDVRRLGHPCHRRCDHLLRVALLALHFLALKNLVDLIGSFFPNEVSPQSLIFCA